MTAMGLKGLDALLDALSDVIKLRFDAGEPVDITPLRVSLKQDAVPVRTKTPLSTLKKEIMSQYVRQLL